jgi:hypothetical protein
VSHAHHGVNQRARLARMRFVHVDHVPTRVDCVRHEFCDPFRTIRNCRSMRAKWECSHRSRRLSVAAYTLVGHWVSTAGNVGSAKLRGRRQSDRGCLSGKQEILRGNMCNQGSVTLLRSLLFQVSVKCRRRKSWHDLRASALLRRTRPRRMQARLRSAQGALDSNVCRQRRGG